MRTCSGAAKFALWTFVSHCRDAEMCLTPAAARERPRCYAASGCAIGPGRTRRPSRISRLTSTEDTSNWRAIWTLPAPHLLGALIVGLILSLRRVTAARGLTMPR
jgi:hypothetical protein